MILYFINLFILYYMYCEQVASQQTKFNILTCHDIFTLTETSWR